MQRRRLRALEEMPWGGHWEDLLSSSFCSWGRAKESLSVHFDMETETCSRSEGRKDLFCPRADWLVAIQLGDRVCPFGTIHSQEREEEESSH